MKECIQKERKNEYGTAVFKGNKKVHLCGSLWDENKAEDSYERNRISAVLKKWLIRGAYRFRCKQYILMRTKI